MHYLRADLAGLVAVALLSSAILSGCRSEICARMLVCCRKIENEQGVGEACGPRAAEVDDRKTCRSILETIGYMYEERDAEPPKACQIEDGEFE